MSDARYPRPVGDKLVTVFGGSGFIGRHVVRALARDGWRVRVAVRRPDLAGHLQPLGGVGQIVATQANLRYPESVAQAVRGATAVVNLVGILAESGKQSFEAVQGKGPRTAAEAAQEAGASTFVQMSAIGADRLARSGYGRSKAEGEAAVADAFPGAVILRPSVVFGPEDAFFNRFAAMARIAPALPLIGGGRTRLQPVFVGDVARAVALAAAAKADAVGAYELGGPEVMTLEDVLRYVLKVTGRSRPLVSVPFGAAKLLGRVLQLLPNAPLTVDQVTMLETDNVVSDEAASAGRTLDGLGVTPTPVDAIAPSYLWSYRRTGQFEKIRGEV